jgi:hypothetical protein
MKQHSSHTKSVFSFQFDGSNRETNESDMQNFVGGEILSIPMDFTHNIFYMLKITSTAMKQNFKVMYSKFNISGICTRGNYAQ